MSRMRNSDKNKGTQPLWLLSANRNVRRNTGTGGSSVNPALADELDRASTMTAINQSEGMMGSLAAQRNERARIQGEADEAEREKRERARLGRGGGMNAIDRYVQSLQKMLTGGSYRQPFDNLTNQLNTMGTQAQGTIDTSMNQLQSFLQAQKNPFEGLTAQRTEVAPALNALLQSQGVDTNPLQQYAATVNAQNAGQATAMQNLMNTLSGLQGANQASALSDVEQNRAALQSQLAASRMGMGAQIGQQAMGQQQNLMQLLLDALSKGGRPRGGRLF